MTYFAVLGQSNVNRASEVTYFINVSLLSHNRVTLVSSPPPHGYYAGILRQSPPACLLAAIMLHSAPVAFRLPALCYNVDKRGSPGEFVGSARGKQMEKVFPERAAHSSQFYT